MIKPLPYSYALETNYKIGETTVAQNTQDCENRFDK